MHAGRSGRSSHAERIIRKFEKNVHAIIFSISDLQQLKTPLFASLRNLLICKYNKWWSAVILLGTISSIYRTQQIRWWWFRFLGWPFAEQFVVVTHRLRANILFILHLECLLHIVEHKNVICVNCHSKWQICYVMNRISSRWSKFAFSSKKKSIGLFLLLGNCKLGLNLQPCIFLSPESEQVVYKLAHVQYVLDDTSLVADSPILHRAHLATNIMDALRLK